MKKKKEKFVINMNELMLNCRKFTTSEIGRGVGIHKSNKGKGSYRRKEKHNQGYNSDIYLYEVCI